MGGLLWKRCLLLLVLVNLDLKGERAIAWNLKVKASGVCLCSLDICWF